ncbi:IS4 family transposase [Streptomyces sp. NRRL S-813]|uniref:IS4 family transposase n=1 Tax=Streptomyces sp. NRRL S-813 TaxID=1463919 RepID=UPI0005689384
MGGTIDVFAPGHIGELTQVVPFELVDAVLQESGARERRLRDLPSRVGVYFVLALGLFEYLGARLVWGKLVAGLTGAVCVPSEKALRDLRRRIGSAPLQRLFEVLAGPLGQPSTAGVRYRRWRTVAFDGCSSITVADHERNRSWLGRVTRRFGVDGYPKLMLMALCETGTRGLIGAVFGPAAEGELAYARRLVSRLTPDMLLLADRAFDRNDLLSEVAAMDAQFLVRCTSARRLPVLALLPDGSYLTRVAGTRLRIVEAEIRAHGADGSLACGTYRLLTTLLDHRTDPAARLVRLYHERWEVESAYFALRHTLLKGRVLRSKDPAGVVQEMWGLLVLYQALRSVMVTAVETVPGCDPDRAGFTTAVESARDTVTRADGLNTTHAPDDGSAVLVGRIGTAILRNLLPRRRPRISARIVKCGISRYHSWNRDGRPTGSVPVTAIDITLHPPALLAAATPTAPAPGHPGRWTQISRILVADPGRPWHLQELASALDLTGMKIKSLSNQLGRWTRSGILTRTAPSTYKIALPDTLTPAATP